MGKNLAHIHFASLTTIWWLSAQVHYDQSGAEMTYFESHLLKKKQFNIIIIHMMHIFSEVKLIPTWYFHALCCVCVQVHFGLSDFELCEASLKDTGEEDILDVYFV